MKKDTEKTRVLFVYPRYSDGAKELLALFPDTGESNFSVGSYAHVGQHGAASAQWLKSKRATKEQYAPLARELESLGYNLQIMNEGK